VKLGRSCWPPARVSPGTRGGVPRCILLVVLRAALIVTALSSTVAAAAPPAHEEIWREIVDPHGAEVATILVRVHDDFRLADEPPDLDPGGTERARFYRDALGMLHYARKLAPENINVLQAVAHAAERLGNTREALEALETALRVSGLDDAAPGVVAPLGALYLRLGRIDDAIRVLRAARPSLTADAEATSALVYLASALSARGDLPEAIDVLVNALPSSPYARMDLPMLSLALAVAYDRDEQPSAAFDVLERMQTRLSSQLGPTLQNDLAATELAPIEDQHYYAGLLYEVVGSYVDARAEWVLYAAMNGRYRARALQHVSEIDAHRRAVREAQ
jgi:tetratricopeptide (TPR) repeat protein